MSAVKTFEDDSQLAIAIAKATTDILWSCINQYDQATWVLAGGMTPLLAYQAIASKYQDTLDWTKVTILIGDERIGALNGSTNNWFAIERILFTLPAKKIRPKSDLTAEEAAADYEQRLNLLPRSDSGLPRLDLLWLGVGDDGHTLSIFPNHDSLFPSGNLVIPVHNSPKPPSDRISLSLRALQGVNNAIVIASGFEKNAAIQGALTGNNSPIALATSIIETHSGNVTWFVDKDAAPTDN